MVCILVQVIKSCILYAICHMFFGYMVSEKQHCILQGYISLAVVGLFRLVFNWHFFWPSSYFTWSGLSSLVNVLSGTWEGEVLQFMCVYMSFCVSGLVVLETTKHNRISQAESFLAFQEAVPQSHYERALQLRQGEPTEYTTLTMKKTSKAALESVVTTSIMNQEFSFVFLLNIRTK